MPNAPIRLDLGCGNAKREGFVGLDYVAGPQVDHVLDLTQDTYPFDDATVDEVFSAHFLEHIDEPNHVFGELGRICKDGARIVIYTPYAFSDGAFLYGHRTFFTEEPWMHFCVYMRDPFVPMLKGRWLLHNINFVVRPEIAAELQANGVSMDFALKYMKGVAWEFGVDIEFQRDLDVPAVVPTRTWSTSRDAEHQPLVATPPLLAPDPAPAAGPRTHRQRIRRLVPRPVVSGVRRLVRA